MLRMWHNSRHKAVGVLQKFKNVKNTMYTKGSSDGMLNA